MYFVMSQFSSDIEVQVSSNKIKKRISSNIPKIGIPRNSVDTRQCRRGSQSSSNTEGSSLKSEENVVESTNKSSGNHLAPVIEGANSKSTTSLSEPSSKSWNKSWKSGIDIDNFAINQSGHDPPRTLDNTHFEGMNKNEIDIDLLHLGPRKSIIPDLGLEKKSFIANNIKPETSLLHNVLQSRLSDIARNQNKKGVKKRWKDTTASVLKKQSIIKSIENNNRLMVNDDYVDGLLNVTQSNHGSNVDLTTHNLSDVAHLEVQHKHQKFYNIAKIFRREKDSAIDTPTIFALLRAAHTVGIATITHRPRDSHELELSVYEQTLRHYLAFVPDLCIVNSLRPKSKALEQLEGVAMFADVSGFTVLCSTYGASQISKLRDTLNTVMGNIVEEILNWGGDIISFAGDAIFALWRTHSIEERSSILPKIIKCSIHIQEAVNFTVDKNITLRVKVGLAVGKMFAYNLEANARNHVAIVGPAVKDVNKAEGCAIAGNIICSKQFLEEMPQYESYPYLPAKKGYIQLWPPKNNAKKAVHDILENLGNGNHVTLDRWKVVKKIGDDLVRQDTLKRYIPDFMRYQLEEGLATGWASQVRSITTLFISLVLADTTVVSVDHSNVQDALTCIDDIVDKMNGSVNKIFTFDKGCTILVAFGTQGLKMNDDPRRALKAAQMIMSSLKHNINDFKGVSIGVTTGACFCGVVGHEERHEYTVIGHQVNLACRLMSNYPFCVACDESTKKQSTLPDEEFSTLPPKVLKGVPPGQLYFKYDTITVDNSVRLNDKLDASNSSQKNMRIVGRSRELDSLHSAMTMLESHDQNKSQNIIIIESQAGYGKTKLLDHYEIIGKRRKYVVIKAALLIDEMTTPFFALKMIMFKLLELNITRNSKNREGVIAKFVPEHLRPDMCLLNDLLGTRFRRDSSRDFGYKTLHKLLKTIIKEIIGSKYYMIIIDNAEYMDQQSWEFMSDLTTLKKRTILVLSMRTTSKRLTKAEANIIHNTRAKRFVLENFGKDEIIEFAKSFLNVRSIPLDLEKVLVEKTHGIPLYCEGLLRKMLKEQVIKVMDDFQVTRAGSRRSSMASQISRISRISRIGRLNTAIGIDSSVPEEQQLLVIPDKDDMCCGTCFPSGNQRKQDSQTSIAPFKDMIPLENLETKICVLNPNVDIAQVALPESIKELFLAQFDRLSVSEQVTIKCCAVLGTQFTLSLLQAVLPHRTPSQITQSIRIMIKEQMLECGGCLGIADECTSVDCSKKYGQNNIDVDRISVCRLMKFKTQFAAEILRSLLLPEQRIRIHETAARILEKKILSYDFCCKKEFFSNVFKISSMGEPLAPMWSNVKNRSQSIDEGVSKKCHCYDMFTTTYPQIIRHYREAGINHNLFEALCSAGALGMALGFTFEALSYLEDAQSLLTKSRTRLNDRHKACLSSLLCLAMYLCPTPTAIRLYREAIRMEGHSQVVYNVSCLSYLCGGKKPLPKIGSLNT